MALRVQPSSATIWSFVSFVSAYWDEYMVNSRYLQEENENITLCDQVWTLISWPLIYSSLRTSGYEMTRDPTTKNVDVNWFSVRNFNNMGAADIEHKQV